MLAPYYSLGRIDTSGGGVAWGRGGGGAGRGGNPVGWSFREEKEKGGVRE